MSPCDSLWLRVAPCGSMWLRVAQCGSGWLHVALVRLKTSRRGALERGRAGPSPQVVFFLPDHQQKGKVTFWLLNTHWSSLQGCSGGRLQSSQSDAVSVAGTLGPQDGAVASMDVNDRRDWGAWVA